MGRKQEGQPRMDGGSSLPLLVTVCAPRLSRARNLFKFLFFLFLATQNFIEPTCEFILASAFTIGLPLSCMTSFFLWMTHLHCNAASVPEIHLLISARDAVCFVMTSVAGWHHISINVILLLWCLMKGNTNSGLTYHDLQDMGKSCEHWNQLARNFNLKWLSFNGGSHFSVALGLYDLWDLAHLFLPYGAGLQSHWVHLSGNVFSLVFHKARSFLSPAGYCTWAPGSACSVECAGWGPK